MAVRQKAAATIRNDTRPDEIDPPSIRQEMVNYTTLVFCFAHDRTLTKKNRHHVVDIRVEIRF